MILFLTNNFAVTKPLYLWLAKKDRVIVYENKIDLKILKRLKPKLIISYNYRYIISEEILRHFKIVNLHISYLPFNRGAHPNIWSHLENTLKGVTIHYIDKGIDSGDIIAQKRVVLNENLTLKESYKKLHFHIQMLFKEKFNSLFKIKPKKQKKKGTIHYVKDLKKINLLSYDITIKELKELNENWKI
jgi:methionyl-tRNA formyltransferase